MSPLVLVVIGAVIFLTAITLIILASISTKHEDNGELVGRLAETSKRADITLEEIELSQPFTERVIIPILRKLGIKTQPQERTEKDTPEKKLLDSKKGFNISVACPTLLSKKFESTFLLQLFLAREYARVKYNIKAEFHDQEISQHISQSELKKGEKIMIKLFHPDFYFSDAVTKIIDNPLTTFTYLGKPKDNCEPGTHKILVSISDSETGEELESFTFTVKIVDFVFGKISRPLLSRVTALVLGIGSFTMFMLTFLEQIDKTIGLTSGTAAGVLTVAISASLYNLYQRVHPITP
jgi:hypothetical protein